MPTGSTGWWTTRSISSPRQAMATGASIWSATIGAAAFPGSSLPAIPSGFARSPCFPGRIPASFLRALALPDGEQKRRSGHHTAFLEPDAVPKLLANDCEWLRSRHMRQGMPKAATDAHMSVLGNEPALEAALAWYRSSGPRQPLGPIKVPTLYLWGDADDTVGRVAAEGTGEFVDAPYQFEVLQASGTTQPIRFPISSPTAAGAHAPASRLGPFAPHAQSPLSPDAIQAGLWYVSTVPVWDQSKPD